MPSGYIFYAGPSLIDGRPIVAVATTRTENEKTGHIVQTWILRQDINPIEAVNTGEDKSICGACPLRGLIRPISEKTRTIRQEDRDTTNKGRSCYVLLYTAPLGIWRAVERGLYPVLSDEHAKQFIGRGLRYGSYGDPVAVPRAAWKQLEQLCTGRAMPGYTHQWRFKRFAHWRTRVMASTHSTEENDAAHDAGWRTFRTVTEVDELTAGEIVCPASPEAGSTHTCETCGACNGRSSNSDRRKSIAIVSHGHSKRGILNRLIHERKGQ